MPELLMAIIKEEGMWYLINFTFAHYGIKQQLPKKEQYNEGIEIIRKQGKGHLIIDLCKHLYNSLTKLHYHGFKKKNWIDTQWYRRSDISSLGFRVLLCFEIFWRSLWFPSIYNHGCNFTNRNRNRSKGNKNRGYNYPNFYTTFFRDWIYS